MIFVVKVQTSKEEQAIDLIAERIRKKKIEVYGLVHPHGLRGYVLIEALDREAAERAVLKLPYVKGLLPKPVEYKEIEKMIEPATAEMKIEKGDIVEILVEPFKREKAKVIRVDKQKEEVVIELLEAAVPIPIKRKLDDVKVIRTAQESEEKE
ncbi:MAG: transcription elongation factor Spt5 [Candidatus Pacearchaeota archaeon]|nr:transcription elongation factor Spt5 [Candidatus Pacearchaeota archaeon]